MRRATSAKGNDYFAVMAKRNDGTRYMSRYGVPVPALADMLPSVATVHGVTFELAPGFTQSGNVKTSGGTTINVDGTELRVTIIVSLKQDGNWNLIAKAIPGAAAKVQSLDDL